MVWQRVDLFPADQPTPHRLVDGLPDDGSVYAAVFQEIQNHTQRAGNSHAVHLLHVAFYKIRSVKE
jgi:hypothetical protein